MKIILKKRGAPFPVVEDNEINIVLQWDDWNDHSYYTTFIAFICRQDQENIRVGHVKVMRKGQVLSERTFSGNDTEITDLSKRSETYCSLGETIKYYEMLMGTLGREVSIEFLTIMQDAAINSDIRSAFQDDDCFKISLLRESQSRVALDTAADIFGLTAKLVNSFSVETSLTGAQAPHIFHFNFDEDEGLPHRVQALVGLNGVGKTQVMAKLAMLMSRFSHKSNREKISTLQTEGMLSPVPSIHNVVAISFSAFDEFERPTVLQGERFKYSYCGLRTQRGRLLSEDELLGNIKKIVTEELDEHKKALLVDVLGRLIRVDDLRSFIFEPAEYDNLYNRLSAGQRIALNAILHTLAKIEERTLILFDEPELHLHPQLLTTMLNSFFKILNHYDSFAIIATHSPIVVQQLPSRNVHVVLRERSTPTVLEPAEELFGENLSEITRQVFMATESDRDFRNSLDELLEKHDFDLEKIGSLFPKGLGLSAQIYLASRKDSFIRQDV